MNAARNAAVVQHHPPQLVAATTSITSSHSANLPVSNMATRDRSQSWRGKYLRALNICPEDADQPQKPGNNATTTEATKTKLRALSYHRADFADRNSLSRSYSSSTEKEDEQRKSMERLAQLDRQRDNQPCPRIQAVPLRAPASNGGMPSASNPYGFMVRPELARGRRCHTDPFVLHDRVSAPILIPSVRSSAATQLDGNDRVSDAMQTPLVANNQQGAVRLLSWEEPVAMLAAAGAVEKGWHMPHGHGDLLLGVRRDKLSSFGVGSGQRDPFGYHVMDPEQDEGDDHHDDGHEGAIFEMEELNESSGDDNAHDQETVCDNAQEGLDPLQHPENSKSRRRFRTASLTIVANGREKRVHRSLLDDELAAADVFSSGFDSHVMSQSFVPPHQLVQRDCFSIGMRDELKRRPTSNI